MKVTIDASRCQGRGYCAKYAPEVFEVDDDGWSSPRHGGLVPPGQEESARTAVAACPEDAITILA